MFHYYYKLKRKIKLYQIRKYKQIDGWLLPPQAFALYETANKLNKNAIIVEIGSWRGKSTYCLAKGLKSGTIFAIDPFNATGNETSEKFYKEKLMSVPLIDEFTNNMTQSGVLNKIKIKQGYSYDFVDDFERIDFLFIDGDHSVDAVRSDFENYSPKIPVGGYLAFHDYFPKEKYPDKIHRGPGWVVDNLVSRENYKFLGDFNGMWLGKKIK